MTNKEFLQWIHDRMINVHNENENYDYMHKLRKLIDDCSVPDVPELVRYRLNSLGELVYSENGSYVLYSQAAEIIMSMIPRVNNCGRYIAEKNDGTLMYLNHGNTWQGCDNFIAAKDKEIERLKETLQEIANSYTAHGYRDAMDAFQQLRDIAKDALHGKY